jgi:molybdate transport system ATP-binding protein
MVNIDINKTFPDFSLDLKLSFASEAAILIGPNGSGKSTILRCIAGLDEPTPHDRINISVMGRIFNDDDNGTKRLLVRERGVGYVSQAPSLFPWLRVKDNVCFGLNKDTQRRERQWIERLFSELELTELLERLPTTLSGGETERVALARALAIRPSILLLDEPFSAIDVEFRPRLRSFLLDIRKELNIPLLMVTHDLAEAHTLGDIIFNIHNGRLIDGKRRGNIINMPMVSY